MKVAVHLQYYILDPGGNVTALITTPVNRSEQPRVAAQLLRSDAFMKFEVEQVGFIEPATRKQVQQRLQMASGELCGNASRCFAALMAYMKGLPKGETNDMKLEISGYAGDYVVPELARAKVIRKQDKLFLVNLILDTNHLFVRPPQVTRPIRLAKEKMVFFKVALSGITHLLIGWDMVPKSMKELLSKEHAGLSTDQLPKLDRVFREIYAKWPRLGAVDACGVITMEEVEPDHYAIRPLVRVNKQGTVYYETACGSGSLAVAYLTNSMTPHKNIVKVEQPSGSTYIVRLKRNTKIEIEADVKIVKKGTIRLQPDVHV